MNTSPRLGAAAAIAFAAAALGGCVTHHVTPTLSKAVVEARKHQHVAAVACPDLSAPVSVGFAFGESGLSDLTAPVLEDVTRGLSCHPNQVALVIGQADSHGTDAEQRQLAQARVTAVTRYLSAHGVAAQRLQSQVTGEPPPADPRRIIVLAEGRRW